MTLTRKVLNHFAYKVTKMRLDLTYANIILVSFGHQILHGTINVLNKSGMQRHGITFQDTSTNKNKKNINKRQNKEKQSYKFKFDIKYSHKKNEQQTF